MIRQGVGFVGDLLKDGGFFKLETESLLCCYIVIHPWDTKLYLTVLSIVPALREPILY